MIDGGSYPSENGLLFVLVERQVEPNIKLFAFNFKPLLLFLRMLFAVTLTGILSWKEDLNNVLAALHKEPGVNRQRSFFLIQSVKKTSSEVLVRATKVWRNNLRAWGIFVHGAFF